MEDILLIDKPAGITSYDVIRILKRRLKEPIPKIGHAGTLDPLATGLIIVGIGNGTKKMREYLGLSKSYRAEVRLGMRTSTGDIEGEILERHDGFNINEMQVRRALSELMGVIYLRVPAYSAVKRGGEALYKKARRGEEVVPPEKEMKVYRAEFIEQHAEGGYRVLVVEFDVGSGTYIRSLAEELGRKLEVPATLQALRRTRIGDFSVEDAESFSFDEIKTALSRGR